ncbi:hypothetical protein Acr_03g0017240 [Actinidia rufa]|uniref:Uncharacterized protein n=1 Tax=Actinidia rufa TaxID=165716 RepID=A0A7J0EF03_9ERIC|nr:hypothetical protein Acr_03g0017240 [Actinidia rufa]
MDSIVSQTHTLELSEKPQVGPTEDEDSSMDPPENGSYTEDEDTDEDDSAECFSGKSLMGLTENLSPTFLSTGNPCLDFFFHVVPDTPAQDLIGRLELAWTHDPLITLKLICNLRGVRGTGKSDKESFYTAAFWLHNHHPKTLASNARAFANFGYFKDLLEILYRILEGPEVRKREKEERLEKRREKSRKVNFPRKMNFPRKVRGKFRRGRKLPKEEKEEKVKIVKTVKTEEEVREERERARVLRKERERARAKKALETYNHDVNYQFLHDRISDFFVELLKSDVQNLKSGNLNKISLAAKWCPTVDSSYDKATLMCESIARKLFPRNSNPEYEGIEEGHYVYRVRDRLRKEVLVPLHRVLELPEVFMSANQWNSLPYNRVASVAMKNYKELFLKHDKERFKEYLENVKSGKAKIAAGALLPHEIIGALGDGDGGEVAELQWRRMVEDLAKKGKLNNCIAVCDVSGSMTGTPMEVAVALGVLVSELSEEPWKGKLITFSTDPELQKVEGDTLLAKTKFVRKMHWGMNTNFQEVFDRILEVAVEGKLREDQMIKRVFVFSDMEFDQASENPWETDYEAIKRKFGEKGYVNVPEIVFWNLRSSNSFPVVAKQSGVALVSGFSKNLLTMFLEGGGIVNPTDVMELAILGDEYKQLVVHD